MPSRASEPPAGFAGLATETRTITGVSKSTGYTYNLDGSVKTLIYPSGRVVTYTPDSAGRLLSAVDGNGTQYVSNATYYASGAEYQRFMPGIYFRTSLNSRLQVSQFYSDNGVVNSFFVDKTYSYGALHQNNGNVISITNNKDSNRSQSFTYDPLNRLTSGWSAANTGAYSWGENYSIDAWGNLQISPMGGKAHGGNFQLSGNAQNRPTGLNYDAAGNMMSYLSATYSYDQENRLSSTSGVTYTYNANGKRVLKSNTVGGAAVKRYWSMGGNTLAEGDGTGNLTAEYIYFGGKRVARIDLPANTAHYYLSDHLSSTSLVASAAGAIEEESDYYPFGTELVMAAGSNHYKFTSKERDSETSLDYFGARYFSNGMGRFVTPDWSAGPATVPYAHLDNPQTLNLYSYVDNNPINGIDPDGHAINHEFDGPSGLDAAPLIEGDSTQSQAVLAFPAMQDGHHRSCFCQGGFWSRLGQRFRNLRSGKGFHTDEQLIPKGTVTTSLPWKYASLIPPLRLPRTLLAFSASPPRQCRRNLAWGMRLLL